MNVSLTPHYDEFIAQKLKSGQYHSASEVVRAALRLLEEQEKIQKARIAYFKGVLQEGIESGASKTWDKDSFLKKARKNAGLDSQD